MKRYWSVLMIEIALTIIFCFLLAWLNVKQLSISYEISRMRKVYKQKKELNSKLMVEKSVLFSPYRLRALAHSLGLESIDPKRVRKIR
jgi:cell division protein FtsL